MMAFALALASLPPRLPPVYVTPHGGELVSIPDPSRELPTDPFLRCATKALRGDYGNLERWQEEAYKKGLAARLKADKPLVLTQYNAHEGRSGRVDCHGKPCGWHTAASNKIPQGYVIWTNLTGLRIICDRGSRRNDRIAARLGGTWVDIWFPSAKVARQHGVDGWVRVVGAVIPMDGDLLWNGH